MDPITPTHPEPVATWWQPDPAWGWSESSSKIPHLSESIEKIKEEAAKMGIQLVRPADMIGRRKENWYLVINFAWMWEKGHAADLRRMEGVVRNPDGDDHLVSDHARWVEEPGQLVPVIPGRICRPKA